jgi:hypothetical protein
MKCRRRWRATTSAGAAERIKNDIAFGREALDQGQQRRDRFLGRVDLIAGVPEGAQSRKQKTAAPQGAARPLSGPSSDAVSERIGKETKQVPMYQNALLGRLAKTGTRADNDRSHFRTASGLVEGERRRSPNGSARA